MSDSNDPKIVRGGDGKSAEAHLDLAATKGKGHDPAEAKGK